MVSNEDFLKMQKAIDRLQIQLSVIAAKQSTLGAMVLGTIHYSIPEHEKEIYTNYVNTLEQNIKNALQDVDDLLYENPNALLIQQKFVLDRSIQSMKSDPSYRQQE